MSAQFLEQNSFIKHYVFYILIVRYQAKKARVLEKLVRKIAKDKAMKDESERIAFEKGNLLKNN